MELLDKINRLKEWNVNCSVGATYDLKTPMFKGDVYSPSTAHIVVVKGKVCVTWSKWIYVFKGDPKSEQRKVIEVIAVEDYLDNEEIVQMVEAAYGKLLEEEQEEMEMRMITDHRKSVWKARYLPEEVQASGRMFDRDEAHRFGIRTWSDGVLNTKTLEVTYAGKVLTYIDIPKSIGTIVEMMYRLECRKNKNACSRDIHGE